MNWLFFAAGLGVGSFIVFVLLAFALVGIRSSNGKDRKETADYYARSISALETRNTIGACQSNWLRKIAEWCEKNGQSPSA